VRDQIAKARREEVTEQQQLEALHLAGMNEAAAHGYPAATVGYQLHTDTAAELRRLHAECEHRMQAINGLTRLANGYHDDLMTLRTAIKKLHAAKSRYHTQIAAFDLYDLLGLKNERTAK
jgi:glutamine synthetase type III